MPPAPSMDWIFAWAEAGAARQPDGVALILMVESKPPATSL
jgi:hypothetical protein